MIRRAQEKDLDRINKLLYQVNNVHHYGRPDLFQKDVKKYNDDELKEIMKDDTKPIFVYTDENDEVLGYAFCIYQMKDGVFMVKNDTLYIDDLCVDEKHRGKHIGKSLYDYVLKYAKENHFYNVTLNVWSLNESAMKFYEKCGLKPQKVGMEVILDEQ